MGTSTRTLKQIAYQQLKEFFVVALYLWVVFGLLVLHKSMILAEHDIPFAAHGFAIINALALAKVMLTAKDLHLGEKFNDAPLSPPASGGWPADKVYREIRRSRRQAGAGTPLTTSSFTTSGAITKESACAKINAQGQWIDRSEHINPSSQPMAVI
jgi:hypothetical protein